jgi:hypothetical protein
MPSIRLNSYASMSEMNKRNLIYFESSTMRALYDSIEEWQHANNHRLHSVSIQKDGENYCCIALTNPTEVVITSVDGKLHADVCAAGIGNILLVSRSGNSF